MKGGGLPGPLRPPCPSPVEQIAEAEGGENNELRIQTVLQHWELKQSSAVM